MGNRERQKKGGAVAAVLCCIAGCAWMYFTVPDGETAVGGETVPAVLAAVESGRREPAEEIGPYDLHSRAAVLMDAGSGRVLYAKNGEEVLPMASTTKIMTCIVALEYGNPDDTVTASAYAASQPKVHLGMSRGNTYRLGDLLYSLMLESHNDSAVAIAEHIGAGLTEVPAAEERTAEDSKKAVSAFTQLMNRKAKDIGCGDTFFITPNGLDATQTVTLADGTGETRQHSTTAGDLAAIMRYCAFLSPQKETFLEITRTSGYSFADVSGRRSYDCVNHNSFLNMMEGALTGKTGFTNGAGYCYVGALKRDGKAFTVALLACGWPNNKTWKWADAKKLMTYGLENYEYRDFGEVEFDESRLGKVAVANGQTDRIGETAYSKARIVREGESGQGSGADNTADMGGPGGLLLRKDEEIKVTCQMRESLPAPVKAGEQIGTIRYFVGDKAYRTDFIVTAQDVPAIDYKWCFGQIWKMFSL